MSETSPIQQSREILARCEELRRSEAFRWFLQEAVLKPMADAMERTLDLKTPMAQADLSRHQFVALHEVADYLDVSEAAAKAHLDSLRKT